MGLIRVNSAQMSCSVNNGDVYIHDISMWLTLLLVQGLTGRGGSELMGGVGSPRSTVSRVECGISCGLLHCDLIS